jgi:hypothetical protein
MSTNVAYLRHDKSEVLVDDPGMVRESAPFASAVYELFDSEGSRSSGILELVQRVFLTRGVEAPRTALFAGIDSATDSGRICALAAHLLSKTARGTVCLVDADLRRPSVHSLLSTAGGPGLIDALTASGPIRSFTIPLSNKLSLLSAGAVEPGSADLLSSDRIETRMKELRTQFEWVILNAPPLHRYADSLALGQYTDGLVLIIEAGQTRREPAQMAVTSLRSSQIPILGAVLNNRAFPIPDKLYAML